MIDKDLSVPKSKYNYFNSLSSTHPWNEIIFKLREYSGCTQEEIALLLEINRKTYSNYEAGISDIRVETIKKIAKLYQIPSSILLGEVDLVKLWGNTDG